jgi:glycine cleavage system aminomethyltransferase T
MTAKRSALFHHHRSSGAAFVEIHGWKVPGVFSTAQQEAAGVRSGARMADVSYRSKFETAIEPPRNWWRLSPGRYLAIGEPPLEAPAQSTDVTSVYADLLLAGPRARQVLGKLSSLNVSEEALPDLSCAQASVAHVHTVVLREDIGGLPSFQLLMGRDYAESAWEAILHAGHEFGLHPFGLEALELLRG